MSPPSQPPGSEAHSNRQELFKFEKKLKRSLLLMDVTPLVTTAMIQTALGQFGTVASIDILNNPLDPRNAPKRVIVEMKDAVQAAHALKEMQQRPFMIKGVPRPIQAFAAEAVHFPDRPCRPGSTKRTCHWVESGDADWQFLCEHKRLLKKHAAEAIYMTQELRKDEEKLAQEQEDKVKENFKKLDEIDGVIKDKVMKKLGRFYGVEFENGDAP